MAEQIWDNPKNIWKAEERGRILQIIKEDIDFLKEHYPKDKEEIHCVARLLNLYEKIEETSHRS